MSRYLVVFNRPRGRVVEVRPIGSSRTDATRARLLAEKEYRANRDIEIVVLSANSEENLHRTHSRYFESISELASRGAAAAEG